MLNVALLVVVFLSGFSINANAGFTVLSGTITENPSGSVVVNALVTAYPTISCGSWTGTSNTTNLAGVYYLYVPDDCNFYIYPTKKNYTFDPVYYYVTPAIVNEKFDFIATFE